MKLIITRHGETEENLKGILQGHLPGKLSLEGKKQAKKLALRLKYEKIDYIYSSDLARSVDTAKEIHKYHKKIPLTLTKELRERYLGKYQGKTKEEVGWDFKDSKNHFKQPKDSENKKQLYKRANNFLHKLQKKHKKDIVLIVGHGGINKALIAVITGKKHNDIYNLPKQHNTNISILELNEDKSHKIHLMNCIKHLD
jgi:broad specificity phosphatase PhoE